MKFHRTNYRIHDIDAGQKAVVGYAVDQDEVPARIAVRKITKGYWACDHWETGFRVTSGCSKEDAAQNGLDLIKHNQKNGRYERSLILAGLKGCLPVAPL